MKMDISRSNCPVGARVTNISYDTKTDYLIHFSDHKGKPSLQQGIRNIPLEESSGSRNLGDAMRFVARHMFKHARLGLVRRKVAVFFLAGWARDAEAVGTDTLGLHVLDITPMAVSFTEEHNLPEALLMDGTSSFLVFVWEPGHQQDVEHLAHCTLCHDPCRPGPRRWTRTWPSWWTAAWTP